MKYELHITTGTNTVMATVIYPVTTPNPTAEQMQEQHNIPNYVIRYCRDIAKRGCFDVRDKTFGKLGRFYPPHMISSIDIKLKE